MVRFRWFWLRLALAAVCCTNILAQNPSNIHAETAQAGAIKQAPTQADAKPASTEMSPPESGSIVSGEEIEALPASGRRWEDFVVGVPADTAQVNGAPADMNLGAQSGAEISVDGVSFQRAFGSSNGRSSNSPSQSSSGTGASEPSGMGRTWSTARGTALGEAAVSQVTSSTGEDISVRAGGSATQIKTRSGGEAFHGQAFVFNRQHMLNAQNPSASLIQQTAPATYATVPVFSQVPFTPSEFELRWGLGMGSRIPRSKLYWFAALDGYDRNNSGVATAKWAENFFAQPSNDQVQVLGAQLGTNNTDALAKYSAMLSTLNGLLGPASRTSKQFSGFGRVDFRIGERHRFNIEATGANRSAPGGGLNRLIENYGSHSFGNGQASQQWFLGRWEAFITSNLLSVTQVSFGRSVEGIHPSAPSQYEQTLNQNVWGNYLKS